VSTTPRSPGPPAGERPHDVADASRRTRLANERTYLAWWRTGLACLAVGLAAGKIIPLLGHGTKWPYQVAGAGFDAIGIAFIALAFARHRQVERAISRGEFAPPDDQMLIALTVAGGVLGVVLFVLVVASSS
jgi:putative membrane protein